MAQAWRPLLQGRHAEQCQPGVSAVALQPQAVRSREQGWLLQHRRPALAMPHRAQRQGPEAGSRPRQPQQQERLTQPQPHPLLPVPLQQRASS